MKSICVYCGSSPGNQAHHAQAARAMAGELVREGIALVYGGGRVGLMGIIADEMLRLGGEVTGVIPDALMKREVGHVALTQLHVVRDMHERKAMMASLSDGFIALPGGFGTMEELFETITWSQLGLHEKPVGVLNTAGFYDGLMRFVSQMQTEGFLRAEHAQLMLCDADPATLLQKMRDQVPDVVTKWLDAESASKIAP